MCTERVDDPNPTIYGGGHDGPILSRGFSPDIHPAECAGRRKMPARPTGVGACFGRAGPPAGGRIENPQWKTVEGITPRRPARQRRSADSSRRAAGSEGCGSRGVR